MFVDDKHLWTVVTHLKLYILLKLFSSTQIDWNSISDEKLARIKFSSRSIAEVVSFQAWAWR